MSDSGSVLRIVGIGGGTGLPQLLRGMSALARGGERVYLTAIVCVSDDGGSSGRLRKAYHVPALGDVRNCLLGLDRQDSLLAQLFRYRFANGRGLAGHALGNLILTALCHQTGSLRKAIAVAAEAMQLSGTVLPATEVPVTLCAQGEDGRRARGECAITAARMRIARVWLEPEAPKPARGVIESIDAADVIVLGPGSLFSSVIPPLLAQGVADAVRRARALRIYVCNLMDEPGETDGFSAADHLRTLTRYLGLDGADVCIFNSQRPRGRLAQRYLATGAAPVDPDGEAAKAVGLIPVVADLLSSEGPKARHDAVALGRLVLELARSRVARRRPARRDVVASQEDACVGSSGT